MALGQVTLLDWAKVLRHELLMGFILGITLGAIGFVRGTFTPEDVRGNMEKRQDDFKIKVPVAQAAVVDAKEEDEMFLHFFRTGNKFVRIHFPAKCLDEKVQEETIQVLLPVGQKTEGVKDVDGKYVVYTIPKESQVRTAAVSRWSLGLVIALAVAVICLWGTLVGSMLPLIFRRLGVDPGIASSPFVATFVDVTGIVIYFSIASIYLL
ncbi:MAG: magnesium transporter [Planctomycetes bacterium]|nr:magnesium transporter [Planctomycetota bacterium]